jgi:hypothetical protein
MEVPYLLFFINIKEYLQMYIGKAIGPKKKDKGIMRDYSAKS